MTSIPLKKKQVAELSAEQQEVIGQMALDEARSRKALRAKAKSYRGFLLVPALIWLAGFCLWGWIGDAAILLPLLFFATLLYIEFHARGINSRIDALLKLLPADHLPGETNRATEGDPTVARLKLD